MMRASYILPLRFTEPHVRELTSYRIPISSPEKKLSQSHVLA